ncbi:interferon omega-1-like [Oryctolagus cuniculus]|uniref:interferon omega-1-like n=1 Tax=Oryctolagus cuniculus TaxID=9986 RepID=UPI003879939F
MAQLLPLLTALVLCSYGPVGSLGCDLPHNSVPLSRTTLVLLDQMRRVSPVLCLKDRRDFQFPREVVNSSQFQKNQTVSVLHEMLQQIFNLLHTARSSAAWNNTLLEELHTALHQQLQGLETCLVQAMGEEDSVLTADSPTLMLKRYFQRIRLYLDEKKHSGCAWELVRMEIRRAFSSTADLQESLRSKDGDLASS